jgi:glycine cleavage system transcriptional repressor
VADRLDLAMTVRPISTEPGQPRLPDTDRSGDGQSYALSVHGADRPGIVHRVALALAASGGNIVDLSTRLVGSTDAPVYVLTISIGFASGMDADAAIADASRSIEAFGVQCHAHRVDIDLL